MPHASQWKCRLHRDCFIGPGHLSNRHRGRKAVIPNYQDTTVTLAQLSKLPGHSNVRHQLDYLILIYWERKQCTEVFKT